jgi:hypothetical protein
MTIKITTANGGSDSLDFGCAQTAIVATVTGTEVSSGEGKLEFKTTTGGTSATKMTIAANGTVTFAGGLGDISVSSLNGGQLGGRRNIVYNGEMKVAQRSASVAGLGAATGYFTLDRWNINTNNSAGRFTMTQTADGPAGFANCLKLDCTTADTSIAASEYLSIKQKFEGQDLQQLHKGIATAKQVTVSFYVKANAVFTFGVELADIDNQRQITKLFDTTTGWVRHEVTYAADVDDGSSPFDDDNGQSLDLNFWLHAGSTYTSGTLNTAAWADVTAANRVAGIDSFYSSTDNEFFITGVQMEIGDTATPFEHRSYGTELALCQRYYEIGGHANSQQFSGDVTNANNYFATIYFNTTKRAAPTIANANANASSFGTGASTAGAQSLNSFRNHRSSNASSVGSFGDTWTATAEL